MLPWTAMGTVNGDTKILEEQRPHRATESPEARWAQGLDGNARPWICTALWQWYPRGKRKEHLMRILPDLTPTGQGG